MVFDIYQVVTALNISSFALSYLRGATDGLILDKLYQIIFFATILLGLAGLLDQDGAYGQVAVVNVSVSSVHQDSSLQPTTNHNYMGNCLPLYSRVAY